jgi:hypothetical protein
VDADPKDLVEPAQAMLQQAGFTLDDNGLSDWCTDPLVMISPKTQCSSRRLRLPCLDEGPHDSMKCGFSARRGGDRIQFLVTGRGEPMDYGARLQIRIQDPTRSVVRLMDNY